MKWARSLSKRKREVEVRGGWCASLPTLKAQCFYTNLVVDNGILLRRAEGMPMGSCEGISSMFGGPLGMFAPKS